MWIDALLARQLLLTGVALLSLAVGISQAGQQIDHKDIAFLQKAAREQLAEIALGKLAMKKASDKKVRDFAAEIAEDHQYASQEIQDLSAKEGIYLPVEPNGRQKKEQRRLARLSGNEFDKAFITYLLKKHRKDVEDLHKNAATIKHEGVKQWAEAAEPILAVHLKKAEYVADALGVHQ